MLDPNYLLHISEGAEDIAEQLHNDIIKRIIDRMMLRIGRGEEYLLTATDKWQMQTLQEAGYLLEDIRAEIAKKTRIQEQEIKEAMEDAGVKAISYDNAIYESVGLYPKPLEESPHLIRLMQRIYIATLGEWNNFTRTTADVAQQLFIRAVDRAYDLVMSGTLGYTEAVKEAVNSIVASGVEVIYPSGHRDTIETATLRAVRTGVSQSSAEIQLARMEEMDMDKVIVSSHLGARPQHHVWQGKIFTLKQLRSTDEGMPAYGTVTGICGANCRHNFSPYIEGMSNPFEQYDSEENLKMYELEQRQRLLERRIRNTKREVLGLRESVDKCQDKKTKKELESQYQRKAALLSKQNKAYKDYCKANNLKERADRISIAKWDRKQAAKARGAAQKYKNRIANNNHKIVVNTAENGIIEAGSSTIAKAKKIVSPAERSKIIQEAIDAPKPFYAEDLRRAYKNYHVKEKAGYYDVLIHGTPHYLEYEHEHILDQETLYYIISGRKDYNGDDIRLLSCSTGKADKYGNCVAQYLADKLRVNVYAPIGVLNINPDGKLTVGRRNLSEEDGFKLFKPREE